MTSGVPWEVEGVPPQARETAREAARRSGMSVGEWLDSVISDSAKSEAEPTIAPFEDTGPRVPGPDLAEVRGRIDEVGRRLGELSGLAPSQTSPTPASLPT